MRFTLKQFAESRAGAALGFCGNNLAAISSLANEATERLLYIFGETGFWGCWDRVAFRVSQSNPYLTLPEGYSRAVNMDICRVPIRVQNEFFEMLSDGVGLQTICECNGIRAAFDRGGFPTAVDLPPTGQLLRIYPTDVRDIGVQVVFSNAKDQNNNGVYSTAALSTMNGFALTVQTPFVTSAFVVTSFSGIEKPKTFGDLVLKSVDSVTGVETLLSRYTPGETNPAYRRYFLNSLPCGCCVPGFPQTTPPSNVITAMLKRDYVPASQPTDIMMVNSFAALKEMCMSVKYGECDSGNGQQLAQVHQRNSVKLLNQELVHFLGAETPAVNVKPYQTIGLRELNLTMQ